ncbi:unnamed protein product [Caenorhabditis bovis]|uniref:Zinc metalloproteinase n=1 Tax=Caenorhabditis bovis TaxID=2654633 RepID=A0A8S1EQK0_9PELO|nr:unnamed protein product [Caenorhabditis bovis]
MAKNLTRDVRKSVAMAIDTLEEQTCIRFKEVDDDQSGDVVRIVDLGSCSSPIGRLNIGVQDVSLTKNCWGMGTAIHELMHAIGIEHTQSRSDRNTYLDINYRNIDRENLPNFELLSPRLWSNLVPYDYGSVMHYSADSFSNSDGEMTMLPKNRDFVETMGSMIPNFYDFDQINKYYEYNCENKKNVAKCSHGGVPNPNDCSKCNCPMGYGGDLCDKRPDGCGKTLRASSSWQTEKLGVKFSKNDDQYYTFCNYWIEAPKNSTILIRYQISSELTRRRICEFGCYDGGIEIKHLADPRITSDRDCCMDTALNVTTTMNPVPVILYTASATIEFDVSYRFV